MRDFIEKGSPQDIDTSCVARVKRPSFFLTPAGPNPNAAATQPAQTRQ